MIIRCIVADLLDLSIRRIVEAEVGVVIQCYLAEHGYRRAVLRPDYREPSETGLNRQAGVVKLRPFVLSPVPLLRDLLEIVVDVDEGKSSREVSVMLAMCPPVS